MTQNRTAVMQAIGEPAARAGKSESVAGEQQENQEESRHHDLRRALDTRPDAAQNRSGGAGDEDERQKDVQRTVSGEAGEEIRLKSLEMVKISRSGSPATSSWLRITRPADAWSGTKLGTVEVAACT